MGGGNYGHAPEHCLTGQLTCCRRTFHRGNSFKHSFNRSFVVPGRDGLQRVLTLYALFWIQNRILGGVFGAHLYKGIEDYSKKGRPACPWPLPSAFTSPPSVSLAAGKAEPWDTGEAGTGRGAGWVRGDVRTCFLASSCSTEPPGNP